MSFSSEVADFMQTLGPFYESIEENESNPGDSGIELDAGNVNALLGNFDDAMVQGSTDMQIKAKSLESRVDKMMQDMNNVQKLMQLPENLSQPQFSDEEDQFEDPSGEFDIESTAFTVNQMSHSMLVDKALNNAVHQLNCDMDHVKARLSTLETLVKSHQSQSAKDRTMLSELSGPTTAFVITWPFVAFALMKLCNK